MYGQIPNIHGSGQSHFETGEYGENHQPWNLEEIYKKRGSAVGHVSRIWKFELLTHFAEHKMALTKLNFITGNKNKLSEVRAILGNVIEVDNQEVDVPEIQGTIEEIAKEKARRAAEAVGLPYLYRLHRT